MNFEQRFSLNTLVRYPHSFERVTKIMFRPNENVLFTCGNDGCFKSWTLVENKRQGLLNNYIEKIKRISKLILFFLLKLT
jgi:hypothetical protein